MRTALLNILARLRRDEKGASMVEYAVALIVVTTIGVTAMTTLGSETAENVNCTNAVLTGVAAAAGAGC